MRYDAVGFALSVLPRSVIPIAHVIDSVDNEGTLGLLLKMACSLSVPGVHA